MDYKDRWHVVDELGEGGQGKVYRARDASRLNTKNLSLPVRKLIHDFSSIPPDKESLKEHFESFCKAIISISHMEDPINYGALKMLHEPKDARDYVRAEERIKKEIEAMSEICHPNLLKILEHDSDAKWFVSEFHPKGTLTDNKNLFTGNFVDALKALRPLVEGVSELHKKGIVHRDIKPQNVFLDLGGNLVLGDFGLVVFTDGQHSRISDTWENVGSRDWMPGWAMGMKIEDIKPTFDVFSLGKLLWAMISNKPILPLWYFDEPDKPQFNLEQMFPDSPSIKLANRLFKLCIVEHEKDCLSDATILLDAVDETLSIITRNADLIIEGENSLCKACGIGRYQLSKGGTVDHDIGIIPGAGKFFKILNCNHCGHIQIFYIGQNPPPAWRV